MGRIGPSRQRYEVLPVPQWDLEELVAAWRAEPGPARREPSAEGADIDAAAPAADAR